MSRGIIRKHYVIHISFPNHEWHLIASPMATSAPTCTATQESPKNTRSDTGTSQQQTAKKIIGDFLFLFVLQRANYVCRLLCSSCIPCTSDTLVQIQDRSPGQRPEYRRSNAPAGLMDIIAKLETGEYNSRLEIRRYKRTKEIQKHKHESGELMYDYLEQQIRTRPCMSLTASFFFSSDQKNEDYS